MGLFKSLGKYCRNGIQANIRLHDCPESKLQKTEKPNLLNTSRIYMDRVGRFLIDFIVSSEDVKIIGFDYGHGC